ncbi:hypothetical protein BDV18DRAFT_149266 [Aspergillus unguis]
MGWLWNSSTTKRDETPVQSQTSPPESLPTSTPSQPQKLSREEQADAEFAQLWTSVKNDINQSEKPQESPAVSQQPPTPDIASAPSSIAPESLYPDTMSCRAAFDYAFFCQSIGGQWVNVYRYGEMRSCSQHWEDFWLCMRTRTSSDHVRRQAIREHNRKKAIKWKSGPSSEDVWDVRMEPVKNAFQGDFAALEREMKAEEENQTKERTLTNTI